MVTIEKEEMESAGRRWDDHDGFSDVDDEPIGEDGPMERKNDVPEVQPRQLTERTWN